jgi:hypothetical protein
MCYNYLKISSFLTLMEFIGPKMTSRAAALAHIVDWDTEFNRPLVDGKITHPVTGEIQQAGKWLTHGPPGVSVHLLNMNADVKLRSTSQVIHVPMEKIYIAVAKHVRDGIYRLVSVNASEYSFVIVCQIEVSAEEFDAIWSNKFAVEAEDESFGPYTTQQTAREFWEAKKNESANEPPVDESKDTEADEQATTE